MLAGQVRQALPNESKENLMLCFGNKRSIGGDGPCCCPDQTPPWFHCCLEEQSCRGCPNSQHYVVPVLNP